jgi:16S rRNA (adenine1518-N6/adenine1519-N6)-dimethyltransferase
MSKRIFSKKRFGQNFLTDKHYQQQLIKFLRLEHNDHIVEIGPGRGALTAYILPQVKRYDAVEIDRDLIGILNTAFSQQANFFLHHADALRFCFDQLYQDQFLRVVGNLPYNIASPLLFHLFQWNRYVEDMHFMLQKEVALRVIAQPSKPSYGRLSVMTQYYCDAKLLMTVPADAFTPAPKVTSAFIQLIPKPVASLPAADARLFAQVVKEAFTYRRKTLSNSLKKYVDADTFRILNIDSMRRAETLSLNEFIQITNAI